jgi:hypothetical protein
MDKGKMTHSPLMSLVNDYDLQSKVNVSKVKACVCVNLFNVTGLLTAGASFRTFRKKTLSDWLCMAPTQMFK